MKTKFIVLLAFIAALETSAQLVTTSNLTVQEYVQNVLLGQNVSVSNITFNGGPANVVSPSVGGFDCPDCNLNIFSGFAMTTGDVAGLEGPNDEGGYLGTGTGGVAGQDPDLLDLVQEIIPGADPNIVDVNDWVIIEFDFVPLGDTLQFQYVWASEEYSEWVGTDFNDIFGFFISGPGINGPYANNAVNIARVPGTNAPVAISTINNGGNNTGPCTSCEYYNQDGQYGAIAADDAVHTENYYMQLDGYTDVLTATAIVQCGQTFHIKLAICDTTDPAYASAVFLQRDSFSSNLVVQTSLNLTAGGPNGDTMYETCGDGYIVFQRPQNGDPNQMLVAELEFSGTAVNGVDYTSMPTSITFDPGVMEVSVYIDAFDDGISEDQETVIMNITNIAECSDATISSSFEFYLADLPEPLQVQGFDYTICEGAVQTVEPLITGGYANYGFLWSTGETTQTIDVAPVISTNYILTVSDTCGMPGDDAQFNVTVLPATPLIVEILDNDNILPLDCTEFGNIYAEVSGGIEPYTYNWTDENGNPFWGTDVLGIGAWNAGTVFLQVLDECGFQGNDDINIPVNAPPLNVTLDATHTVDCGDNCNLGVVVSGGDIQGMSYNYEWLFNNATDWNLWGVDTYTAAALQPGTISIIVSDQCGQSEQAFCQLIINSPLIDLSLPQDLAGNCATLFDIIPIINGGSGDPNAWNYNWSGNTNAIGNGPSLSSTFASDTDVAVSVVDVCGQSATATTVIDITNPTVTISLGDDINASCIDDTALNAEIIGGSGGESFQWIIDGTVEANTPDFSVQSFETVDVIVNITDACLETARDTITIFIPDIPLSISVADDTLICPGQPAVLYAAAEGGETPYTFWWNEDYFGEMVDVNPDATTNYHLVVRDICGRQLESDMVVELNPVIANFSFTNTGDDTYTFTALPLPACDNCTYIWNFGDDETAYDSIATHQYDGLNDYTPTLTIITEIGCANTQEALIQGPAYFYVPSAFTPNGDGLNDVFEVVGSSIMEYELTIFNRWGNVIFHSTDPKEVWLGDSSAGDFYVPNASYNYVLRIKGFNTETIQRTGEINIMR
jgi:gliding motility-associated-like protein